MAGRPLTSAPVSRRWVAFAVLALALTSSGARAGSASKTDGDPGLDTFRSWLERERPKYGCDEGPAPFHNKTVEAAYPQQRFYYALTYTRGIPPPYRNSVSVVAAIDDEGRVVPFRPRSPATYRRGLRLVKSTKDAKLAAAAVLILGSCDPNERRWPYKPDLFKTRKTSKGWKATYRHDANHSSWVAFDRKGAFLEFGGSAPPVP